MHTRAAADSFAAGGFVRLANLDIKGDPMSAANTTTDMRAIARDTRNLIRGASAALAGRERGPDRRVRRNSYDADDDPRAQVFAPIGDGTKAGAMGWIDALLQTAKEFDDLQRAPGGARPLGTAIAVLEVLLGRRGRTKIPIDFKTGRLDPAIDTIAAAAALGRGTVIRALAALKRHGFLDWVRRTRKTGNDGQYGPQRQQTSNAYFFSLNGMAKRVRQRLRDLLARKRIAREARAAAPPPTEPPPSRKPHNSALSEALGALGAAVANASPPNAPLSLGSEG